MKLTDAEIADALRSLPAPAATERFWQELERLFVNDLGEHGSITDGTAVLVTENPARRRSVAIKRVLLAAAVVVALLLVADVIAGRSPSPPASPARPSVQLHDPRAISLDPWLDSAPQWPPGEPQRYLVFNLDRLPAGWTAGGLTGGAALAPSAQSYSWQVILSDAAGDRVAVYVAGIPGLAGPPFPGERVLDIRGHEASWTSPGHLSWLETPETLVSMQPVNDLATALDVDQLADLARQLVPVEAVPDMSARDSALVVPDSASFAGTIDGHPWYGAIQPGGQSMLVRQADATAIVGRSSTTPDDTTQLGVVGSPDGIVVFGRTPPNATTVRVLLSDSTSIGLPTVQAANNRWFVAPIPNGLDVVALEPLDAAGTALGHTDVPAYPTFVAGEASYGRPLGDIDLSSPASSSTG